jgi:hypothetical protein
MEMDKMEKNQTKEKNETKPKTEDELLEIKLKELEQKNIEEMDKRITSLKVQVYDSSIIVDKKQKEIQSITQETQKLNDEIIKLVNEKQNLIVKRKE